MVIMVGQFHIMNIFHCTRRINKSTSQQQPGNKYETPTMIPNKGNQQHVPSPMDNGENRHNHLHQQAMGIECFIACQGFIDA